MNWYSRISYLNDPNEFYFKDNTGIEDIQKLKNSLCVCSFSKNNNSILMWSHYTDNHYGVCLEWDFDVEKYKGAFFEVQYSDEINVIDKVERTNSGHLHLNINTNGKFMNTKFKEWSYEEEIRMIRVEENPELKGLYGEFPGELVAIYFGIKVSTEDIELVKANSRHFEKIKFYKVVFNPIANFIEI